MATGTARRRLSPIATWWMVGLMCLVNTIAFIDRQSLPLLVQPVEHDLHLTDTQMSLVIGAAFVIVWAVLGLWAGVLVDRVNRKVALAIGACFWGVMTISCGWATSFVTLCIGRMGVGIGESVAGPTAVSLIKDGVDPTHRGRALGVYALGASLGGALALLGGGAVLALFNDRPEVTLPLLGTMRSWQVVLAASGLLAFPLAALVLTIQDPGRDTTANEPQRGAGLGVAMRYMLAHWQVFVPLFIANGATIIMLIGYQIWQPSLFARVWHLSRPQIGLGLGLITLVLSTGSQFCAGWLIDWLERRGITRAAAIVGFGATIAALLPAIFSPIAPTLDLAWLLAAIYAFLTVGFFTIGLSALARLTPNPIMGRVSSFHYFWMGVIGTGVGPAVIAIVSDNVFTGPAAISHAMSLVCAIMDVVAMACFAWLYAKWPRPAEAGIAGAQPARA